MSGEVYRTTKPRYIVQRLEGNNDFGGYDHDWTDEEGFASYAQATKEADRLQGLYPSSTFRVFDSHAAEGGPVQLSEVPKLIFTKKAP